MTKRYWADQIILFSNRNHNNHTTEIGAFKSQRSKVKLKEKQFTPNNNIQLNVLFVNLVN